MTDLCAFGYSFLPALHGRRQITVLFFQCRTECPIIGRVWCGWVFVVNRAKPTSALLPVKPLKVTKRSCDKTFYIFLFSRCYSTTPGNMSSNSTCVVHFLYNLIDNRLNKKLCNSLKRWLCTYLFIRKLYSFLYYTHSN